MEAPQPEQPQADQFQAEHLTSPLLTQAGFRHAFFTRRGGVSEGRYGSLNFSIAVGDEPDRVATNLRRAETALGLTSGRLFFLWQVHENGVVELHGEERVPEMLEVRGDALISDCPSLGCGVRTADCIPILLADPVTGRAAAVHAGWRGVVCGVVRSTLARFVRSERLLAAIGPHISGMAFEVSPEVADQLGSSSRAEAVLIEAPGRNPRVDLRKIVRAQLEEAGLLPRHVDDVLGCTWSDPERFFSYRRDGQQSGRHLSVIVPRG